LDLARVFRTEILKVGSLYVQKSVQNHKFKDWSVQLFTGDNFFGFKIYNVAGGAGVTNTVLILNTDFFQYERFLGKISPKRSKIGHFLTIHPNTLFSRTKNVRVGSKDCKVLSESEVCKQWYWPVRKVKFIIVRKFVTLRDTFWRNREIWWNRKNPTFF